MANDTTDNKDDLMSNMSDEGLEDLERTISESDASQ